MNRGFTLIETVIASLTLALALTMIVVLVQQYSRVQRQAQDSLQRLAPRQVLAELADEARMAIEVAEPAGASPGQRLIFQRVRPNAPPVIGNDPWPVARQMTVTYTLQQAELWRRWEWPGQVSQQELMAAEVQLFEVSQPQSHILQIKLNQHQETVRLWRD